MTPRQFFYGLRLRLSPFWDPSAMVLLSASLLPLWFVDRPMFLTLVQWTAYGLALAGLTIVISRLLLPQLRIDYYLRVIADGSARSLPTAIVVAATIVSMGLIFLGLAVWAKS